MQEEINGLATELLDVSIIAVNEKGYGTPSNYESTGAQGVLPVLQDDEVDGTEVWDLWEVVYRDVMIVDECGEKVGTFNLTSSSLQVEDNYAALKNMIIEAATVIGPPH